MYEVKGKNVPEMRESFLNTDDNKFFVHQSSNAPSFLIWMSQCDNVEYAYVELTLEEGITQSSTINEFCNVFSYDYSNKNMDLVFYLVSTSDKVRREYLNNPVGFQDIVKVLNKCPIPKRNKITLKFDSDKTVDVAKIAAHFPPENYKIEIVPMDLFVKDLMKKFSKSGYEVKQGHNEFEQRLVQQ